MFLKKWWSLLNFIKVKIFVNTHFFSAQIMTEKFVNMATQRQAMVCRMLKPNRDCSVLRKFINFRKKKVNGNRIKNDSIIPRRPPGTRNLLSNTL